MALTIKKYVLFLLWECYNKGKEITMRRINMSRSLNSSIATDSILAKVIGILGFSLENEDPRRNKLMALPLLPIKQSISNLGTLKSPNKQSR